MYVNNIVLLYEAGHSGMIDDTSSDDQEVTRMEDVLLENIDMLSDKRYRTVVYVDVHMCGAFVVQKTDFLLSLTLIKCLVKRLLLICLLEGGHLL